LRLTPKEINAQQVDQQKWCRDKEGKALISLIDEHDFFMFSHHPMTKITAVNPAISAMV
jgi:hypothetical protein